MFVKTVKIMKLNKKRMCRAYLSAIVLLAYFSLNVGFAAGSVLCIHTDGDVLFKFNSCEVCCSSCSDHSNESINDRAGISKEFQTEDSCCPCSDIPVSTYISQFHSKGPEDIKASCIYAAYSSRLVFTPKTKAGVFGEPRIFSYMNQIFSLLKTAILLN